MKPPVSFDLFPGDVCPAPSEFLRLRLGRDAFFDELRKVRDRRSRRYPCALSDARLQLYLLGDLGSVW